MVISKKWLLVYNVLKYILYDIPTNLNIMHVTKAQTQIHCRYKTVISLSIDHIVAIIIILKMKVY
jgi:hypothetical protein